MNLLKKCCNKTQANVNHGKLILTCPNAVTPIVWQMDVARTASSSMEVHPKDNHFELIMKAGSNRETIAVFEDKEAAVAALMAASKAIQSAENTPLSCANENAPSGTPHVIYKQKSGLARKILTWLAGFIVVFVVFNLLIALIGGRSGPSTEKAAIEDTTSGRPMSADDFLSGR